MSLRPIAALLPLAFAASISAQEPKLPDVKTFDKLVVDTLRDVHNKGADLYNIKKDFEGTYRMYHGSLLTVRPLLGHHPDVQKLIDNALAAAEKEASVAQKAFRLHEAIEAVRSNLKGETARNPDDQKPDDKKDKKEKGAERSKGKAAAGGGPGFRGTVTFKGQPVPAGEVIFVSLDKPKPIVISAAIQDNGQYAPMGAVPPGKYVVIVKGKHIPEKYQLTTTSGLEIEVQAPPTVFDINLI
jgi:hypothetical protein